MPPDCRVPTSPAARRSGLPELVESAARWPMSAFDRTRPPWRRFSTKVCPAKRPLPVKDASLLTDGSRRRPAARPAPLPRPQPTPTRPAPTPSSQPGSWASPLGCSPIRSHDVTSVPSLLKTAGPARSGAEQPGGHAALGPPGTAHRAKDAQPLAAASSPLLAERRARLAVRRARRHSRTCVPPPGAGGTLHDAYLASLAGWLPALSRRNWVDTWSRSRWRSDLGAPAPATPAVGTGSPGPGSPPRSHGRPRARSEQVRNWCCARSEPAIDSMGPGVSHAGPTARPS